MTRTGGSTINPTPLASTAGTGSRFRQLLDGRQSQMNRGTTIEAGMWVDQFAAVGHRATIRKNSLIEDRVGIRAGTVVGEHVVMANRSWAGLSVIADNHSVIKGHIGDSARISAGCRLIGDLIHHQLDPIPGLH